MARVRCRKCGCSFEEDRTEYCGRDFCLDCRGAPQDDVAGSYEESFEQYKRMGYNRDEADRKAREFANDIARERARRGR